MDGLNIVSFFKKNNFWRIVNGLFWSTPPSTKPHLDTFLSLFAIELSGYSTSPYQQQYMY
jgi:hypothetical protein